MSEETYQEFINIAQAKMDQKTKPLGSLGVLETIATRLAAIKGSLSPSVEKKRMLVYAGTHGIAKEGVSAYPAEVTGQMVLNFIRGGAAINVITQANNIELFVIDAGVEMSYPEGVIDHPTFFYLPVGQGTTSFLSQNAMSAEACEKAVQIGRNQVDLAIEQGIDLIGIGEMGIGNTTSAAALYAALLSLEPAEVTGPGTGLDEKGIKHKIDVIQDALNYHRNIQKSPMDWLAAVGGYEIAAMVGTILEASAQNLPVVVDGFIATAAATVAFEHDPKSKEVCFFAHCSKETAHRKILETLEVQPILDLDMRLGEGTGASLCMPIIDSAAQVLCRMATFDSAGVSESESDVHKRA